MPKLAVLTNELPPYRRPIFERLAQRRWLDVTVLLSSRVEAYRQWDALQEMANVNIRIVRSFSLFVRQRNRVRIVQFPYGAIWGLARQRPNVVISGEFGFRTLVSWLYCAFSRVPLIIWSEEIPLGALHASRLQQRLRRFLSARADGFLAWGQPARRYLLSLGVPESRISDCVQAVDNGHWGEAVPLVDTAAVRASHGMEGPTALYVGNLFKPKGVDYLIEAWAKMPLTVQEGSTLVVIGGGEERESLEALAARLGAQNVLFLGPIPHAEMPAYYASADFLVLPTLLDVWGLTVNEAMASGIPVLCSQFAGCAEELIVKGKTGDIFDPYDTGALSALIAEWLQQQRPKPDPAIQSHIAAWNFDRTVEGILDRLAKLGFHPATDESIVDQRA